MPEDRLFLYKYDLMVLAFRIQSEPKFVFILYSVFTVLGGGDK